MEKEYEYSVTFYGLQKWYKDMFEKLGWMLLAERDGRDYKIVSYKEGLKNLVQAIEEKMTYTHDVDKLQDLKFLHKNVMTLCEHVNKDFKSGKTSLSNKRRTLRAKLSHPGTRSRTRSSSRK